MKLEKQQIQNQKQCSQQGQSNENSKQQSTQNESNTQLFNLTIQKLKNIQSSLQKNKNITIQSLDGRINKKLNKYGKNFSYDLKSEKNSNLEQFHEAQKYVLKRDTQCLSEQKKERVISNIKFHDGETIYQFDRSNIMTPQHNHFSKFFADKQFEFERKIKSREAPFRQSIYNENIGSPTSDFSEQNIQNEAQNIVSQQSQSQKYSNMHHSFLNKVEVQNTEIKSKISNMIQGYRNRILQKDKFESFH